MAAINEFEKKTTGRFNALRKIDFLLIILLVFTFAIRLYGIENPFVDFSSWRQIDTVSIAKFFAETDFNIFHPQLLYDGPGPNYGQLELQITTSLIALLFKFVGVRELYARIIPVILFTASALFLFLFVKRYTNRATALLTIFIYSILPMGIYYGRAVQPESAMLCFGIASLYTFSIWMDKKTIPSYVLAVATGTLSVLAKLPNAFLFLPIAAMAIQTFGKKTFRKKSVYAYFAIILTVTAGYFLYLGWFAANEGSPYDYHNYVKSSEGTGSFVSNIASKHIIPQMFTAITSPEGKNYLNEYLVNMVTTPIGFVLMLAGLLLFIVERITRVKSRPNEGSLLPLYAWAATAMLYTVSIAAIVKIDYYLVPVIPIAAFFIARALQTLTLKKITWPLALIIIAVLSYQSFLAVSPLYSLDMESYTSGTELRKEFRANEPVILGTYNPSILFYSGHKGWRSIDLSLEELLFLKSEGAGYYIPLNSTRDKKLVEYLNVRYQLHTTQSGCRYYDLKKPRNP